MVRYASHLIQFRLFHHDLLFDLLVFMLSARHLLPDTSRVHLLLLCQLLSKLLHLVVLLPSVVLRLFERFAQLVFYLFVFASGFLHKRTNGFSTPFRSPLPGNAADDPRDGAFPSQHSESSPCSLLRPRVPLRARSSRADIQSSVACDECPHPEEESMMADRVPEIIGNTR